MKRKRIRKKALDPKGISYAVAAVLFAVLCLLGAVLFLGERAPFSDTPCETSGGITLPEWVDVQLIRVDGASRRGVPLEGVRDIAVHYVGNPNTTAMANRNYFDSPDSTVSSHFIVGLEGEVILCVPLDEKSSATNERNRDTISVEVCHPDSEGKFSEVTEESLIRLLIWLCENFDLSEENLIRHYDVTGKKCPLYYVEHPEEWERIKSSVAKGLQDKENV
ncbi:MAG: N-acetylmuramoyl-L-alanine amidase [Clostridia bacterium]|nr:N-acetylmuramoyl-L-alanine amidase [Clostridia bacterium]